MARRRHRPEPRVLGLEAGDLRGGGGAPRRRPAPAPAARGGAARRGRRRRRRRAAGRGRVAASRSKSSSAASGARPRRRPRRPAAPAARAAARGSSPASSGRRAAEDRRRDGLGRRPRDLELLPRFLDRRRPRAAGRRGRPRRGARSVVAGEGVEGPGRRRRASTPSRASGPRAAARASAFLSRGAGASSSAKGRTPLSGPSERSPQAALSRTGRRAGRLEQGAACWGRRAVVREGVERGGGRRHGLLAAGCYKAARRRLELTLVGHGAASDSRTPALRCGRC